jgi:hypothetical protein
MGRRLAAATRSAHPHERVHTRGGKCVESSRERPDLPAWAAGGSSSGATERESSPTRAAGMAESKSPRRLKDELGSLLGRLEALPLGSRSRSLKLLRAYLRLREARIRSGLRSRVLLLLGLLVACLLCYLASSYSQSLRFERVSVPYFARRCAPSSTSQQAL